MLQSLLIKNYALIDNLQLSPSPNFNIITGETGAGKSIILGAIGLLTGDRADTKTLLNQEEKCVIEGVFDLSGYHLEPSFSANELDFETISTIRREISPQGKSRAFINDTPVNLETLKEITGALMDVHSQHDNLLLGSSDFQLNIIDVFAANKALLSEYKTAYQTYKQRKKQLEQLTEMAGKSKKDFDYENFLLQELSDLHLSPGEQETLEEELNVLENAEEIKTRLNLGIQGLSEGEISVQSGISAMITNMGQISRLSPVYEDFKARLASCLTELRDLTKEMEREEAKIEADPQRSAIVQERLNTIYKLHKKHQTSTIQELLDIRSALFDKVQSYESVDSQILETEKLIKASLERLTSLSLHVTESREHFFGYIETNLSALLVELGMPNASFRIKNETMDFTETGRDKIMMLFSANKGIEPVPLKNAASGGEFSRLMFALKYLMADKTSLPTIIFDEIDTGISGEIAMKMGQMMKLMGTRHQIITITHLHQIAARGDMHFFVFKEDSEIRTFTQIRKLSQDERINELAKMIGGKNPSNTAYESAKELMSS